MANWKRILLEDDVAGDGIITVTSSPSALHTVSLGDPAGLPQLTNPVVITDEEDKILIWDESESEWSWISADNFPFENLGNTNLTQTDSSRTFDVFDGGSLKFINNSNAKTVFHNTDGSSIISIVSIGNSVESVSDAGNKFSGIAISATLPNDGTLAGTDHTGYWVEGGYFTADESEAPIRCVYERSYDVDNFEPNNGDGISDLIFYAPSTNYLDQWSNYGGGGGSQYAKITASIVHTGEGGSVGSPNFIAGALELKAMHADPASINSFTDPRTVIRIDDVGARINESTNSYYLATTRGGSGQVLHSDGSGLTYWAENIPSTYYNSSYGFINAELQTALFYVNTTAFQQVQLNLAETTASGVDITEGYNISISTTDNTNLDSVTFSGLDETMDTFSVTISGTIEWITQSSGYVQVWCEAVESDASSNTQSLFNSQVATYKQLILPQTPYQASAGGSAPIGGTSASFTYTVPQIGQINGQPVEDIVFKLYVQMLYGTGNHYFRLSELNISINN